MTTPPCDWPLAILYSFILHVLEVQKGPKSLSTGRSKVMPNPNFCGYDWSNRRHVSRQFFKILVGEGQIQRTSWELELQTTGGAVSSPTINRG
jgi:hypothetical protein